MPEIGSLVGFLILVLIVVVVIWGLRLGVNYLELPDPVKQLVLVIASVIALCVLLFSALHRLGVNAVIW